MALLVLGLALANCNQRSCRRCSVSGQQCEICNNYLNYISDGNGGCMSVYVERCQLVDDFGQCLVCQSGYFPQRGVCRTATITNCAKYAYNSQTNSLVCEWCAGGFVLRDNLNCVALATAQTRITNCFTYEYNAGSINAPTCLRCNVGYYLSNNACVAYPNDCLAVSQYVCNECAANTFANSVGVDFRSNYYLYNNAYNNYDSSNVNNGLVGALCGSIADVNCVQASSLTVCTRCRAGYYLNNNSCAAVSTTIANCAVYSTSTTCSICEAGYFLSGNTCLASPARIDNCVYYQAANVCARCAAGFYPSGNACVAVALNPQTGLAPVPNCEIYSAATTCFACAAGYYLSNSNTCTLIQQTITNCRYYTNSGCQFCAAGFYLNGQACAATSVITNCSIYASQTTCAECQPLFYRTNSDTQCTSVSIANCAYFNADGTCAYCDRSTYLSGAACLNVSPIIANCLIYDAATTCFQCVANYSLNTVDRKSCNVMAITDCNVFTSATQCQYCNANFWYDATRNQCVPTTSVSSCGRYSDAGTCIFCAGQFYLTGNRCVARTTEIANCESYATENTCGRCKTGFFVSGGTCTEVLTSNKIADCSYYDQNEVCAECFSNKYKTTDCSNLTLVPVRFCAAHSDTLFGATTQRTCVRCIDNYYLDGSNACQPVVTVVANCFIYSNASTCQYCAIGFKITGNQCAVFQSIPNCSVYASASTCSICAAGYVLNTNQCVAIDAASLIANCIVYSSASPVTCARCAENNFLMNNACYSIGNNLNNCLYRGGNFSCAICRGGFYLVNNQCAAVTTLINNCEQYGATQQCEFCRTGYLLSNNACIYSGIAIANCRVYSSASTCTQCNAGFYLQNTTTCAATNAVPNCFTYESSTLCSACQPNFALNADRNVCIANCLTASGNLCSVCAGDYFLNGSSVCTAVTTTIANCSRYSANGQCSRCNASYYLDANACVLVPNQTSCLNLVRAASTQCLLCRDGYYSNNGVCTLNSSLGNVAARNCAIYAPDSTGAYKCQLCTVNGYQTSYLSQCTNVNPVFAYYVFAPILTCLLAVFSFLL